MIKLFSLNQTDEQLFITNNDASNLAQDNTQNQFASSDQHKMPHRQSQLTGRLPRYFLPKYLSQRPHELLGQLFKEPGLCPSRPRILQRSLYLSTAILQPH
jgi:hypothetical protein